jgi:cytochrome c5
MKKTIIAFTILTAIISSCAPKVVVEQEVTPVKEQTVTKPEVKYLEGKTLFDNNCGKCHDLPHPSQYSKAQWAKIVPPMAKEAKLDATQENQILLYVQYGAMN